MDATETKNSLGHADRPHSEPAHPPLPVWVPPVCAVLFGAGVALQAANDARPGLMAPFLGLALALAGWALLRVVRSRQGVPRRNPVPWLRVAAVVIVPALHYYALQSTADLHWLYNTLGVAVAGFLWYRLQRKPRQ